MQIAQTLPGYMPMMENFATVIRGRNQPVVQELGGMEAQDISYPVIAAFI